MGDVKRARTAAAAAKSSDAGADAPNPAAQQQQQQQQQQAPQNDAGAPLASNDNGAEQPRRSFAMVCSSNMNRSMEAHKQLMRRGLKVASFGVGTMVRLPAPRGQAVFPFGTPYRDILAALKEGEDEGAWYRANGLLSMLERNVEIKDHPERWQLVDRLSGRFDVVFCFEERVFDALTEDVASREPEDSDEPRPVHIINLEVPDNTEEAVIGAQVALDVCVRANEAAQLDEELPTIIEDAQRRYGRPFLHQTVYV